MNYKLRLSIIALKVANQNNNWYLPTPITVRLSDNDFDLMEIHGLCVSPKDDLYILTLEDGHGYPVETWNPLEVTDRNAEKLVDAIHARVFETYKQLEEAV